MDSGASSYHRFLEGDESGLEEIVEMYSDNLIFFINGFVNNLTVAEDLMTETFLALIVKKAHFKGYSSFKTYLFKIGRNNALDYLRKQKRITVVPVDNTESEAADMDSIEVKILKDEQQRQLHNALQKINVDYREVLYLLYFEDMCNEDVAVVLRKNKKQVENLTYRAKQALKTTLKKEGFVYEKL